MINFFKYIVLLLCLGLGIFAEAQNDVKLSNFAFTPLVYNPAYAGSSGGYNINGFYSSQWVGFEGAPETIMLTGHSKIGFSNVGVGFDIISDKIGASSENKVAGNAAYHFKISRNWSVSAGIKFGLVNYAIDYTLLSIRDPNEFGSPLGDLSKTSLIFGTGVYIHRNNFFIGASIPNFLPTEYLDNFSNTIANTSPNYFLTAGYKIELDRNIYLQPTVLTRLAQGAPYSALVAFNLDWEDKFFANVNYEHNVSAGAFAGVRITDRIMAGYSYDASTRAFSQYNSGIHSFMINFRSGERERADRCGCFTY